MNVAPMALVATCTIYMVSVLLCMCTALLHKKKYTVSATSYYRTASNSHKGTFNNSLQPSNTEELQLYICVGLLQAVFTLVWPHETPYDQPLGQAASSPQSSAIW